MRTTGAIAAAAIAQGCNIVRGELGLPSTYVPAADGRLQTDVVQTARASDSE